MDLSYGSGVINRNGTWKLMKLSQGGNGDAIDLNHGSGAINRNGTWKLMKLPQGGSLL